MRATILQLQEEYDNYTTHHKITPTREQRNVMARFAFMVAARDLYTTLEIAKVCKKNHATIIHATKGHEMNLKFDRNYMQFFNQCWAIMDKLRGSQEEGIDWGLTKQNALLTERLQKTREELSITREKLYIMEQDMIQLKKEYELCD